MVVIQHPHRARRFRALAAAVSGVGLIAAPLAAPAFAAPAQELQVSSAQGEAKVTESFEDGRYFVVLKGQPSVTYSGGVEGFAPTAAEGEKFVVDRPEVAKYEQHLRVEQEAVASVVGAEVGMQFSRALNAFVAELTADQARSLEKDERVLAVVKDEQQAPDYSSSEFLGLPGPDGTWNSTYGGAENAGKGVVVGVIDTGIHPDNPFIEGQPLQPLSGSPVVGEPYLTQDGRAAVLKADGSTAFADCETGPGFPAESCTDKLIGAYAFSDDFEQFVPVNQRHPEERISPLGVFSHGTHVATTILGNTDVEQVIDGTSFGVGNGVAPAANLISYKVCWEDNDPNTGGCYGSASVAAVEQAIENNVDVLNYSISGSNTTIVDPVALAFRAAAEAGIFVAASGGNSGPTANTVNHSSPWLTTVAAETFSNELTATVEFEDGTKYRGASSAGTGVGPAEVIHASEVASGDAEAARLCLPGSLTAEAADKIVLCERGQNARVEKSEVVAEAGGIGMILVNTPTGSLDADVHSVPTVHINDTDGVIEKVKANDLTATIVRGDTTGLPQDPLPQIAGFSSRGPSNAVNQEFLKPDVAAPGVNVIAGVSPLDPDYNGNEFGLMSGTSMASPNLAGMAALLVGKETDWSPMAVKSALMTTAGDVYNADGSVNVDNFATGAGSADPKAAARPGLVYESDARQWDGLLLGEIAGRDVNVPSVVIPDLVNDATVTRTVTATQAGTWAFDADVPGFEITASPSTVSLAEGESAEVTLTVTRTDAELNQWVHGSMSWVRPAAQSVTSPVTLRAMAAEVTSHVEGQGPSGSATVEITPGFTGEMTPSIVGLAKAETSETTKVPGANASTVENASSMVREVTVGEGVEALNLSITAGASSADWDLYVITPAGRQISAATAAASESLTINNPAPGRYLVIGYLYSTADGGSDTATFESLQLTGDAGNLTVTPNPVPVTSGLETEAELAWSGLTEGVWRGVVTWAPGVTTTVTVTVGAGGGPVDPTPETCDVVDFRDNPEGSQYYSAVRWMQCEGITTGHADGTYRKHADISRGQSLAFMYRYLDPEFTAPATSPFRDVEVGSTFYEAITWAAATGVTKGYSDNTFKQYQDVTRAEFAAFVFRAVGDEDFQVPAESPFTDLMPGQTHYQAITWMESEGLLKGYQDGSFGVAKPITRGEVAVIMERVDAMMQEG